MRFFPLKRSSIDGGQFFALPVSKTNCFFFGPLTGRETRLSLRGRRLTGLILRAESKYDCQVFIRERFEKVNCVKISFAINRSILIFLHFDVYAYRFYIRQMETALYIPGEAITIAVNNVRDVCSLFRNTYSSINLWTLIRENIIRRIWLRRF